MSTFNAIVAEDVDGKTRGRLKSLTLADLPDEDVLVDVAYSTVNFKDGLAVSGKGKICRSLPMVCGIDLAGTVVSSRHPDWTPGDKVIVNGYGLSERHWGGYAQKQRVKAEWLVRLPEAFTLHDAMAIGTAGYTAMLSVLAILDHGVKPGDGPVLVTGATGGVGSVAVMLLARLGYEVIGSTGKPEGRDFLLKIGARDSIDRAVLNADAKPLESEKWAAVVDSVGSKTLGRALAETRYEGIVAACGLAGGTDLPTTVLPFILRGVTLRGIDSVMAAMPRRLRAWDALARHLDPAMLRAVTRTEPLARVPELADDILAGKIAGRVVIDVNA